MTDYSLWPVASGPGAAIVDGGVVLATEFYVDATGLYVRSLRFWRADTSILGPVTGRVYDVLDATSGGAVAGTDVTWTLAGTGWQVADLAAPVALTANQRYRVAAQFPTNYSATSDYFSSGAGAAGLVDGPLHAPSATGATGGDQGSFVVAGALAYPVNQFRSTAYWVDVIVTDQPGPVPTPTPLRERVTGREGVGTLMGREAVGVLVGRLGTATLTGEEPSAN